MNEENLRTAGAMISAHFLLYYVGGYNLGWRQIWGDVIVHNLLK